MAIIKVRSLFFLLVLLYFFASSLVAFEETSSAAHSFSKEEGADKRLRYGQVELVTPEGYIEVPVDSAYYSLAALDAARFPVQGLVRLFIPVGKLPY